MIISIIFVMSHYDPTSFSVVIASGFTIKCVVFRKWDEVVCVRQHDAVSIYHRYMHPLAFSPVNLWAYRKASLCLFEWPSGTSHAALQHWLWSHCYAL